MERFQLVFDKRIPALEKENRWKTAVDIVLQQWMARPNDLNCLLCAGTQLWYTLLVMDDNRIDPCPEDNIEIVPDMQLKNSLMNVTRYGFKHFGDDPVFNVYFGYMISLMPFLFLDYNGDYLGWEAKGSEMIKRSYSLDPDSPFTRALYHGLKCCDENMQYDDACKELWSKITPTQWGDSEVQKYFFFILKGTLFYADAYSQ